MKINKFAYYVLDFSFLPGNKYVNMNHHLFQRLWLSNFHPVFQQMTRRERSVSRVNQRMCEPDSRDLAGTDQ